jgi:hypothetical protein
VCRRVCVLCWCSTPVLCMAHRCRHLQRHCKAAVLLFANPSLWPPPVCVADGGRHTGAQGGGLVRLHGFFLVFRTPSAVLCLAAVRCQVLLMPGSCALSDALLHRRSCGCRHVSRRCCAFCRRSLSAGCPMHAAAVWSATPPLVDSERISN